MSTAPQSAARGAAAVNRIIISLGATNVALYIVYMGVLQLLLPHQLRLIDASDSVYLFGVVTGIGAFVATVANPIAGALSDRTRTRFGRRTPWLVVVAFLATPALALLGGMDTVFGVIVGWCLVQAVMNCFQASLAAILPERVPEARRGAASALVGIGVSLGIMLGTLLARQFVENLPLAYGMLGVTFGVVGLLFVLFNPEPPLPPAAEQARAPFNLVAFFSALRDGDFRWTFISRFLINLNYCATTTFHFFLLHDYATLQPEQNPDAALVVVNAVGMSCMAGSTLASGWLSDLAQRRKVFVSGAASALACSALIPIAWPTFEGVLAFAICNGLAMGCYLAVDNALVTQVLPDEKSQARDLGIFNIASAGPQIMGPFVASLIVAHLGGYAPMLAYGAAMAAISAFTILRVRKVR